MTSRNTCETGVCEGVRAFGPPRGYVHGLGYCHVCEPRTQRIEEHVEDTDDWDDEGPDADDLVDALLYDDGLA